MPASNPNSARRRSTRIREHGPLYVMGVVGLTVFLFGLAFCREPIEGYSVEAKVRRTVAGQSSANATKTAIAQTANAIDQLKSADAIRQAMKKLRGTEPDARLTQLIRNQLRIFANATGDATFTVSFTASTEDEGKRFVQTLLNDFIQRSASLQEGEASCEKCGAARVSAAAAKMNLRKVQEQLDAFVAEHGITLGIVEQDGRKTLAAKPSTAEPTAPPSVVKRNEPEPANQLPLSAPTTASGAPPANDVAQSQGGRVNPATEPLPPGAGDLRVRLEQLLAARSDLLSRFTSDHPGVLDLYWQIDSTQRAIAALPPPNVESGSTDDVADLAGNTTPPQIEATTLSTPAEVNREITDGYRVLKTVVDGARQKYEDAVEAERQAWQAHWSRPAQVMQIVDPPHAVATIGGGIARSSVMGVAIAALTLGALAGYFARSRMKQASFISVAQLGRLSIPVVATIPTRDGPPLPASEFNTPAAVHWLTLACEVLLATFFLLVVFLAMADAALATELLRDPIRGFSDALARAAGWLS